MKKGLTGLIFILTNLLLQAQTKMPDSVWVNSVSLRFGGVGHYNMAEKLNSAEGLLNEHAKPFNNRKVISESFSTGIALRHRVNDLKTYRFKADLDRIKFRNNRYDTDTTGIKSVETDLEQNIVSINPGVSWQFQYRRIKLLTGVELDWKLYGDLQYVEYKVDKSSTTNAIFYTGRKEYRSEGGFSIGPGGFVAMELQLLKILSLGFEFNSSLVYSNLGGEVNVSDVSSLGTVEYTLQDTFKGFEMMQPKFMLTLQMKI